MALCEKCGVVLRHEPLPEEWFDTATRCVMTPDGPVRIGPVEWRLISTLWQYRQSGFVSRDRITAAIYGMRSDPPGPELINVHLCHIRRKLRGAPYTIVNRYGLGFRLAGPGCATDAATK